MISETVLQLITVLIHFSYLFSYYRLFSHFTAGYKHLLMECQETKIQSRKNETAFISQLAETSPELKIPQLWVWELWSRSDNADSQIRNPSCKPRGEGFLTLSFGAALLLLILFASSTELIPQPQTSELSYSLEMKLLLAALSWCGERLIDR